MRPIEATRHALMFDPAFNGGNYSAQPENGWRMRADVLQVIATRTPEAMRRQFPNPTDVLPWIAAQEQAAVKSGFDANDWIAQTWAYDRHNVGDTPVDGKLPFGGDHIKALRSVKAKALLMSGQLDLYNPVEEGIEAAAAIPDGRHVTIPSVQGHVAASVGYKPADLEFINQTVSAFMPSSRITGRICRLGSGHQRIRCATDKSEYPGDVVDAKLSLRPLEVQPRLRGTNESLGLSITHQRPCFCQRAPGHTSRRKSTSSGFQANRMVSIPRDPQMARESYRLDESLRKTKILATEDYPKIGRRRTTIKLHAVRSLAPSATIRAAA